MNVFEAVKGHVSTREAAQRYGVEVNRYGKARCPFHNDRHPSLFVSDDHYHCFACGEHGDVIDFTAKLYGLSLIEAAQKLASDFCLTPDKPIPKTAQIKNGTEAQQLMENERLCFSVLNDYLWLLRDWQKRYAPRTPEDTPNDRFVEACHKIALTEYRLDILLQGDSYERAEIINELMADGHIHKLQVCLKKEKHHERTWVDR